MMYVRIQLHFWPAATLPQRSGSNVWMNCWNHCPGVSQRQISQL